MSSPWYCRERTAWGVLALFAVILGLISFPNHYLLRTHAMDLGLYTHVLWQYAHGIVHDSTLFLDHPQSILADHFDLYLPLFSPLVFVFGTWTLLIVQWSSMLIGAWGVRKLLLALGKTTGMALLGMTLFLMFFGLYAAASYDYHSNVVAAMLMPWFMLALVRGWPTRACLLLLAMLIAKENMGFWVGVVALVMVSDVSIGRRMRWVAFSCGVVSLAWSFVVMGWVMPALSSDAHYMHFDYSILGEGIGDVPRSLVSKPWEILKAFFIDHYGHYQGTEIKLEFWCMMLLAGGWAFILVPRFGLMALPLLAQKMLNDHEGKWSVVSQYSIEFAPLVAVAAVLALSRTKAPRWRTWLCLLALTASFATLIRFMDNTYVGQNRARIRLYQARHYTCHYNAAEARMVMERIPATARVSAQTSALPHLALCEKVYLFPIVLDADHIVLLPSDETYPLSKEAWIDKVEELKHDPAWRLVEDTPAVLHLVRSTLATSD